MSDAREQWRNALAPAAGCIDVARLGEELDAASRAHLETCVRCQSELALHREMQESSAEEIAAGEWIAAELHRRAASNVTPFRPRSARVLYAVAAALIVAVGIGAFLMREPSLDPMGGPGVYRSARLEAIAPIGDLAQPPNELRWSAVPNASRYQVKIVEVDGTLVWSARTTRTDVALPSDVIAQFAPGKSLLWDVQAFRGNEMLATSGTRTVRVSVTPVRNDR